MLENFAAFASAEMEFVPGVNAFIGENGTGKTHLLKLLYAVQKGSRDGFNGVWQKLLGVFQVDNLNSLIRHAGQRSDFLFAKGQFGEIKWGHKIYYGQPKAGGVVHEGHPATPDFSRFETVFLPSIDMMGHTKGFLSTYRRSEIDFDETLFDIVDNLLLPALKTLEEAQIRLISELQDIIGGKLELQGERFYLSGQHGRFEMPIVAEGLRKVASLVRLIQVGVLGKGLGLAPNKIEEEHSNLYDRSIRKASGEAIEARVDGRQLLDGEHLPQPEVHNIESWNRSHPEMSVSRLK